MPGLDPVEVATDLGPLLVHADDEVITPILRHHGTWEKELGDLVRSLLKPGMTAVDVGGNIGYVALLMAEAVGPSGRVIAIEPDPRNAELLRRNAERTRGAAIEVVEAAAWSHPTTLELALNPTNTGDHRVGLAGSERTLVPVAAVTLDDVLPDRVDLMLLDTQASEHVALRGARRVLQQAAPVVFVEFWPRGLREGGHDPVAVLGEYRAMGLSRSGAEDPLPQDDAELVRTVESAEVPFTTLRLQPRGPLSRRFRRLLTQLPAAPRSRGR